MRPRSPSHPALDPLVRRFITLADEKGVALSTIGDRAGLPHNVPYRWNRGSIPSLLNFEAALNAIGYKLEIVEK